MKNNVGRTTIVVDTSIRDKLKQYGVKGETYEDIIVKLMKFYDASRQRPIQELTQKKKKKVQLLDRPEELIGSVDYVASHEIDQIIKKGRDRIKHAITISDEKLTKTKKEIVREMAVQLEKAGYPVNQICDRLSKSLKSLVNDRTVRDALESKYKDQSQSQVAEQPKSMMAAVFTANRNNSEKRP